MKKLLLTVIILSNILIAQQTEFIVGAEHVSAMGNFAWYGDLPHSDYYWNKVKEFGLNYAGLKYFQKYPNDINPTVGTRSKTDIIADINKANALGIKVFLYNGFDHYESNPRVDPQRWVYQVEKVTGNDLNDFSNVPTGQALNDPEPDPILQALTHWNLAPPEEGTPNFLHFDPLLHSYGLVASDLREQNLQPDGQKYQLKIRMRLPDAVTYEHVSVCTLKVYFDEGAEIEDYVYADDFSDNNWKEIHVLCFLKTIEGPIACSGDDPPDIYTYPDSVGTNQIPNMVIDPEVTNTPYDYRIYWSSTAPYNYTVDIDYIAVDDLNAHKLFTHAWDNRITDAVNNDYLNNQGIVNFQAHDEVPVTHLFATRYIQQKMQSVLGNSDRYPLGYHYYCPAIQFTHPAPITKRYIWETGMNVLFTFVYPFHWSDTVFPDDPDKIAYDEYVQENTFDSVLIPSLEDHIAGALQFGKPFWFVPQAHKWYKWNQQWQREPSPYEIKAMTNLAVCYGVKGILYYLYAHSWVDRDSINGFYYHDPNNYDGLIREYDDYGYPKWNTIKDYNHQLLAMGDELMSLTWLGATSINQQEPIPNPYITSVQTFYNSVPDPANETYVELGYFKKTDEQNNDNLEHFYVVNRRTWLDNQTFEGDSRDIRIQYDKSSTNPNNFYNWTVRELGTNNYWSSASPTNQLTTTYEPGDGKLFKLQPTVMGGGDLLYNETISSNIELHGDLTIEENVTLTVNADYHCYGNIYLKYGSDIAGTGTCYFHDGGQIIVTDDAATIWGSSSTNKLTFDFIDIENYSGIFVDEGGYLMMVNAVVRNSGVGVYTIRNFKYVSLVNIDFENCSDEYYCVNLAGPSTQRPWVSNCTFSNSFGAVIATNFPEIVIQNCHITECDAGINLSSVTQPYIISNVISSTKRTMPAIFLSSCNGIVRSNLINGHSNGILLANSSPDLGDNFIDHNFYHGIYIGAGSLPDMHAELMGTDPNYYAISGYNTIWENGGYTTGGTPDNDGSEIYFGSSTSNANMSKGCNSIFDNRSPQGDRPPYNTRLLMNGYSFGIPITVYAERNYWSVNPLYPLSTRFGNLNVYYDPVLSDPCDYDVEGQTLLIKTSEGDVVDTVYSIDRTVGTLSATDVLYSKAEEKYLSAEYTGAEQFYNQVVSSNDSLYGKQLAYQRLYEIGKLTSKPASYFNDLYNAFNSASQSTEDSLLQKKFSQLASLSLAGQEEYIPAIGEFDEVIQQNPGTEEAVFAEIDALTTALLIEHGDTTLGKTAAGKYMMNSNEYNKRINQLLQKNFGANNENKEETIAPTDYVLYQNYPNPFNPVTTIKFDIPNPGQTELIIYDILGNKVKTLLNEIKQPGRYEISWDASGVASGVYIYQLKINNFFTSKKMILLK